MTDKWFGWTGTILRIDLTRRKVVKQPLPKEMAHDFLGGRGFNIKILWDELKPGIDPLGPENVLCFGMGPLNGTLVPLTSRFNISCLSPLNGILGDGNAGGHWNAETKYAGYDQVVVTGKSEKPVYVWIDDDTVEIRDAKEIWGKMAVDADEALKEEVGDNRARVACIGPAGENLVRFAGTMSDKYRIGTPGSGAVWGSKNLKAIVARGTKGIEVANSEKFLKLVEEDRKGLMENEFIQGQTGVIGTLWLLNMIKDFKNAQEQYETKPWVEDAFQKFVTQRKGCFNCPVHCAMYYEIKSGPYAGLRGSTAEHHCLVALGTFCGMTKFDSIIELYDLVNNYGLDCGPTGRVIAVALEMAQNGLITKEEADGLTMEWGNAETGIALIHKIANREGFGNQLAEGDYNFAKAKGALEYTLHIKGYSRYASRGSNAGLLYYMTATRGSDHLRGAQMVWPRGPDRDDYAKFFGDPSFFDQDVWQNKHITTVFWQNEFTLADLLERCKCGVNNWFMMCPTAAARRSIKESIEGRAELLSAVTGKDWTANGLSEVADRVWTLERAFSTRLGITRKHDWPPPKSFTPVPGKPNLKTTDPKILEQLLDNYYTARGWDLKTGIPTRKRLEELRLGYVADELEAHMPYPEWTGPILWPLDKYPSRKWK
jgi:aldehyde:ferredoxin oxidoreductase